VLSLIRFTPPRHAIRRAQQSIRRRRAAKVMAAPLVSAIVVVGDGADLSSSPQPHAASSLLSDRHPGHTALRALRAHRTPRTTPSTTSTTPPTTTPLTTVAPVATTTATAHTSASPAAPRRSAAPAVRSAAPPAKAAAPTTTPPVAVAPRLARSAKTIPLAVFTNGSPGGVSAFAAATGTHPTFVSDYLLGNGGWGTMVAASNVRTWSGSGYTPILGVPIIPNGTGGTLAAGASGAYDGYFVTLARNLVSAGAANAYLRLGWEFNGNWYPWSVGNATDAANFAGYWRHIVDAMRSVPGQSFSFVWNPNGDGPTNYTPDQAYPGSGYVDFIGTDMYDNCWCSPQTPQAGWASQLTHAWGLDWLSSFAASQGKPIVFPEWGLSRRSDGHGLGDDPYFVNQFAAWITQNNVAWTSYFNADPGGQADAITDGTFPNALAAFRQDFG